LAVARHQAPGVRSTELDHGGFSVPTKISFLNTNGGYFDSEVVTEDTSAVVEEVNAALHSNMKFVQFTRQKDNKSITFIAKNINGMEDA
jgi:hypothetical protein